MKWSRYNVMFKKSKGDGYLLYNTMSGAFLELCNEDASVLEKIRDGKFLATELEPKALRFLTENGVFVESDDVELAKFKLLKQYNRMDDSYMALTIAPTLSCNLHCPYCFEKEHPNIFMTDEVENGIVDFIKGHKNVRRMKVSWFGGEPLLAFDRIVTLTKKIREIPQIKAYTAEIITNGTNFTKDMVLRLNELDIKTVHITIDGLEAVHNERRKGICEENTFEKIIQALDWLVKYDEISKTIRVNIDKANSSQFEKVYRLIAKKYPGKNFNTYVGFIKDSYGCGLSCHGCYTTQEQGKFIMETYKKLGVKTQTLLPTRYNYECIARFRNGYLIGPKGDLYKCWTDLGNPDMCIGNIMDLQNLSIGLLAEYMVGADPFEDPSCVKCKIFPTCGGGCPHARVMNKYHGVNNNTCHFSKGHLEEFLETYYSL